MSAVSIAAAVAVFRLHMLSITTAIGALILGAVGFRLQMSDINDVRLQKRSGYVKVGLAFLCYTLAIACAMVAFVAVWLAQRLE